MFSIVRSKSVIRKNLRLFYVRNSFSQSTVFGYSRKSEAIKTVKVMSEYATPDIDISDTEIFLRPEPVSYKKLIIDITNFLELVLTILALIYGVTSWCFMKKFRSYRNFVNLNAILANFLLNLLATIANYDDDFGFKAPNWLFELFSYPCLYFTTVRSFWLVVICHMFYVDFVKVFNDPVQKRFLKSSLFAWGIPLLITGMSTLISADLIFMHVTKLVLSLNCILYIVIVYSLYRSFNTSDQTAANIWRRLYIATLIFILSDLIMFLYFIIVLPVFHSEIVLTLGVLLMRLNVIILDVFIVFVKSNRELWYQLYVNRSLARHRNHDIHRIREIIREPGDGLPAVSVN